MTALYMLVAQYSEAAQKLADLDLDEQTIADTLESLSGELELKAQNIGMLVRALESDAAAMKAWAKTAAERSASMQARAERLQQYLSDNLQACGIKRVSGPGIELSFRKSTRVVIDEPDLVPLVFMRVKPPPPLEPDKTAIAAALKNGSEIPGAHLEERLNLQIK